MENREIIFAVQEIPPEANYLPPLKINSVIIFLIIYGIICFSVGIWLVMKITGNQSQDDSLKIKY